MPGDVMGFYVYEITKCNCPDGMRGSERERRKRWKTTNKNKVNKTTIEFNEEFCN